MRTLAPTLRMTQARFLLSLLDEPLQSKPLGVNVEGSTTFEVEQPQDESHAMLCELKRVVLRFDWSW